MDLVFCISLRLWLDPTVSYTTLISFYGVFVSPFRASKPLGVIRFLLFIFLAASSSASLMAINFEPRLDHLFVTDLEDFLSAIVAGLYLRSKFYWIPPRKCAILFLIPAFFVLMFGISLFSVLVRRFTVFYGGFIVVGNLLNEHKV